MQTYSNIMMAKLSHILNFFKNKFQRYVFRTCTCIWDCLETRPVICILMYPVGERVACWIGVRLAVHDFVFNTECWDILFNENLDCEQI